MMRRLFWPRELQTRHPAAIAALLAAPLLINGCAQTGAGGLLQTADTSAVASRFGNTEHKVGTARGAKSSGQSVALSETLKEARRLRSKNRKLAALNVLDKATQHFPDNRSLATEHALLSLEAGRIAQAEKLLRSAIGKSPGDWRLHSALGAALASQSRHNEAVGEFDTALRLSPRNTTVLNNLALAHAMAGNLAKAEKMLRRVVSKSNGGNSSHRASQNLALVLGFSGKLSEAKRVASSTLPPETAQANIAYLTRLSSTAGISRAHSKTEDRRTDRLASLPRDG
jgi:Flp pilus assembly protein TadD